MPAPLLMVLAAFLFASMGTCVKLAAEFYTAGELVFYRNVVGVIVMLVTLKTQRIGFRTAYPMSHFWRVLLGSSALCMWFYAITGLPVATAMTLNYMSSVWMAIFLIAGSVALGTSRVDGRMIAIVIAGFLGVALVLRPTIEHEQLWHGLIGLLSGVISAMAYLQIQALGRLGEPDQRVVFYFSVGGVVMGGASMLWTGASPHTLYGLALLLAIGGLATVAQLFVTKAYRVGKPLVNASLNYLGIAFAFGYGVLVFDDPVTRSALAGMALIVVAGIAAARLRPASRNRADDAPQVDS